MRKIKKEIPIIVFLLLCSTFTNTARADDKPPTSSAPAANCSSKLAALPKSIPFNSSSLSCFVAWSKKDFIILVKNDKPGLWSFVLSAPDVDAYIAVGFSPNGKMVGSSAMAGWISSEAKGIVKQYSLKGEEPQLCPPDQGNLPLVSGSTTIIRSSSRLYLAFQLNTTQPLSNLIYAVGPDGRLPDAEFYLPEHEADISTKIDYTAAAVDVDDDNIPPSTPPAGACSSKLTLPANSIPFNTSFLRCNDVWKARDFVLLVKNDRPGLWSFVLSAPDVDAYIAVGFSPNGKMVGSSAMAGWISSEGKGIAKQYSLKGEESLLCPPDQGNLPLVNGSTTIIRSSSRLYLAFQLNTTQPLSNLIYAIGPKGRLPDAAFYLPVHEADISTKFNYTADSSTTPLDDGDDDDDKITPSSAPAGTCSSKLSVSENSIPFDTSSLRCNVAWSARDFVLLFKNDQPGLWSFVLSAPDVNAYIAVGFSPNGKMVGSSALAGWISSDGKGIAKQYDLRGEKSSLCPPDQGSLTLVNGSTTIIRDSSRLYLAFQLKTTQPLSNLIYALGPVGQLPGATFLLPEHQADISTTIDYSTGVTSGGDDEGSDTLLKAHGLLNLIGWGALMPIGIMVARYAKSWDPAWFYSHIFIQAIGLGLGIAGIVTGFRLEDKEKEEVDTHKALGIVVLVLASLQATAVLIRPGKESKVRKLWNWGHHNGGRIAIGFAIGNIFYGLSLAHADKSWFIGYGVFLGLWVLLSLILELLSCTGKSKRGDSRV